MVEDPTVRIESLATGGRGVARLPSGKVVLVRGSAPGDLVRVRIEREKRDVTFARTTEVLEASEHRVESPCLLAGRCGGCSWSHMKLQAQRAFKREMLEGLLQRAGLPVEVPPVSGGADLGYRWRTRLHLQAQVLGPLEEASHRVLAQAGCRIMAPPLDLFAREAADVCARMPPLDAQLELYVDAEGRRGMYVMIPDAISAPSWQRAAGELSVHSLKIQGSEAGETPWLQERSGDLPLAFTPGVFVQANREMNAVMVGLVAREAGSGERLAEVYAGAGNLTVSLAAGFRTGWAAEGDPAAARALAHNLAQRGPRLEARTEDERTTGQRLRRGPMSDVLVTDPPRRGMKRLLGGKLQPPARRIVMASCHPATAVRDLASLVRQGGYRLLSVTPLDMFPQTHHLEIVALLEIG